MPPTRPRRTCHCGRGWPAFTIGDLDTELYQRHSVVKHLAMRRTLWVVRAEDLPTIQHAASDRVADNERRRLVGDAQKARITDDGDAWLEAARDAVLQYLAEHGPTAPGSYARRCHS